MSERIPVAVAGATGVVGQYLLVMLRGHPWFEVAELFASEKSAGRPFRDAVRWAVESPMPDGVESLVLRALDDGARSPLVFSCLSAAVAREAEPRFVHEGHLVVSNASAFRLMPDVPLLIPEVNPEALRLLAIPRGGERTGGVVTNPNCVVAGVALALAPLHRRFGARRAVVVTLQAASGAGIPGHAAVELIDNVIPYIDDEEEKIAAETARILDTPLVLSAAVHRVPVLHGHTAAVFVETEEPVEVEEMIHLWEEFRPPDEVARLPSCPARPLAYRRDIRRPQPRMDRMTGDGMTVVVGRARSCPVMGFVFEVCVHNLVRGAAGAALLNAELCAQRGLIP